MARKKQPATPSIFKAPKGEKKPVVIKKPANKKVPGNPPGNKVKWQLPPVVIKKKPKKKK